MSRARTAAALTAPLALALAATLAPATSSAAPAAPSDAAGATARALGLGSGEQLIQRTVGRTPDGVTHTRYDRRVDGLRVVGGDIVVHSDAKGAVQRTTWGRGRAVALSDKTPKVSAAAAQATARATATGLAGTPTVSSELVIHNGDAGPRLAHEVVVKGIRTDQTPTALHVAVDAKTGAVLESWDTVTPGTGNGIHVGNVTVGTSGSAPSFQMVDALGHRTTDLKGATTGAGTVLTDADDVWGNGTMSDRASVGVDAQFGAQKTYDYFLTTFGRKGIWDTGKGAPSRVHYGNAYDNAFWDGTQMTYGDGAGNANPLTSLDVSGHEMTHGVTENTAGLAYRAESGGLNEATSDIFGTMVEFYAASPVDAGDYLIGEELGSAPFRYMDKPSKDGRSADCYSSKVGRLNVHYSSGPLNHWFYLASEGSGATSVGGVSYNSPTCNSKAVVGAGRDVAAKVWYATLTNELTSRSGYADAREGAIRQAKAIYGKGSAQCSSIAAAFDGIAVPAGTQTCSN